MYTQSQKEVLKEAIEKLSGTREERSAYLHRVITIRGELVQRAAEYEEECAEWHEKGYRAKYCEHGAYMWVDYDCVCGPCENGLPSYRYAEGRFYLARFYADGGYIL